jgi:hypothetical protein
LRNRREPRQHFEPTLRLSSLGGLGTEAINEGLQMLTNCPLAGFLKTNSVAK